MLTLAEITKLAETIISNVPILAGISNVAEHQQALDLLDKLIEDYDANLVVIEALSNVIARYEDESLLFETFNNRQAELDLVDFFYFEEAGKPVMQMGAARE